MTAAVVAAAAVAAAGYWTTTGSTDPYAPHGAAPIAAPEVYQAPGWEAVLGGDTAPTASTWATLGDPARSDLPPADAAVLADLGRRVTVADLTGAGRDALAGLYPPASGTPATVRCTRVQLLASAAAKLPVAGPGRYAKVLTAWTGTCGPTDPGAADTPQVTYTYAHATAAGWQPVRAWAVPVAAPPTTDPQAVAEPADWQLTALTGCGTGNSTFRARLEVAPAFAAMCRAAATDGVTLTVESAYRSRAEQAKLFTDAVNYYGSPDAARRWVAYADSTTCTSKHCAGTAINVVPTPAALRWLTATVGCDTGGQIVAATSCAVGSTVVPRSARYGFIAPASQVPGYYEFVVPLTADGPAPADCNPAGVSVAQMVASIFRCRLSLAGVRPDVTADVVAQALVVSRAESGWNAAARAYAGRFAVDPNPADGKTYTQAGVFLISAAVADAGWVPGGKDALTDPVANINGAASLWLATRGFEQFGTATGRGAGFTAGPVLPQYGGPPLPKWAGQY